jgi:DNA-binding NtrC family response regulator
VDSILFVEDNSKLLKLMEKKFTSRGYSVFTSTTLKGAPPLIRKEKIGVVVLDLMLNDENGMDGIPVFLELDPNIQILIVTGYASIETAVEAMRRGAYDYIQKPVDIAVLSKTIDNAFRFRELKQENSLLRRQLLKSNYCLETRSAIMNELYSKARKLAQAEIPILLLGESGTGKEVLADYIHHHSTRQNGPIVKVNSSAFPEGLLENELFGHEKNSFTGANSTYKGLFEQAGKGSLFLDEIGDMGLSVQAKILRALQNQEVRRIGGEKTISVDVRLIAATNMDLTVLIQEKLFREDLYYRINTAILHIPPLRDRKEDVPLLINHFLKEKNVGRKNNPTVAPDALKLLTTYSWPGNIRELKNVMEYSLAMSGNHTISLNHLPPLLQNQNTQKHRKEGMTVTDRQLIIQTLQECRFNKKLSAEKLEISRKTLYEKMKKYDIEY